MILFSLVLMGFTVITVYQLSRTDREKTAQFSVPPNENIKDYLYSISEVPSGYSQSDILNNENTVTTFFTNENGDTLMFIQAPAQTYILDNETDQETIRLNNGNIAYFSDKGEVIAIFWRDKDSFLSIAAPLDKETMIAIANSITENK